MAYIFGLGLTIFIMHIFKHAQVSSAAQRHVLGGTCQLGHEVPASCQEKAAAFLVLTLVLQCHPVPFPAQNLCAWLEESPVWDKAGLGSCVSNSSTSVGLSCVFVALCNQAGPADPPSMLQRGPGSTGDAVTALYRALDVSVAHWDLTARVLCWCSCILALKAASGALTLCVAL